MKKFNKIIVLFFITLMIYSFSVLASNNKLKVSFYKKVDGDTAKFKLDGAVITVRFLGINTPEAEGPYREEETFGKEASQYTENKLKNANSIEIEYDEAASKTDKYDRTLAYVWVDNVLLQEELIQKGLATTYMLQDNYKYAERLKNAEENAKTNKVGIWINESSQILNENIETETETEAKSENTFASKNINNSFNININAAIVLAVVVIISIFGMLKKK